MYDAAYLELALRLGLPLASKDARLRKRRGQAGLALLGRDRRPAAAGSGLERLAAA